MAKSYYEGLLEVKAIRAAKQDLPPWVGFADDCTCACCASLFTWASTSNTEAQAARDKHNCRSCGSLVCDPCSTKRASIPEIGISQPVRVCDRCYNGWGAEEGDVDLDTDDDVGAKGGEAGGAKGGLDDVPSPGEKVFGEKKKKRENKRPSNSRRSAVVDELAS